MRRLPRLFLILAALLGPDSSRAQIATRFAWPDNLQGTVTYTRSQTRTGASATPGGSATLVYGFQATRGSNSIVVLQTPIRIDPKGAPASASDAQRRQMEAVMSAALPTYIVGLGGDFQKIEDIAAFRGSVLKFWAATLPPRADNPKPWQMVDQLTSDRALTAFAANQWNNLVGYWTNSKLIPGQTYSHESESPIPIFPDRTFKMTSHIKSSVEIQCARAGKPRKCIEIDVRTVPDPEAIRAAIKDLMQKNSSRGENAANAIESLDIDESMKLITEPEGLIPHRLETQKRVTVSTANGADSQSSVALDSTSLTFEYLPSVADDAGATKH